MSPIVWSSIIFAWPVSVVWLIARAYRQQRLLPSIKSASSCFTACRIAVVVPARDEEANIEECLRSILIQDFPQNLLDLIVVDDDSSDSTLSKAKSIAQTSSRLKVLEAPSLPSTWVGKSYACWVGVSAARSDAEWLCFIDADMRSDPRLISAALSISQGNKLDLLSLAPRLDLVSFAERLIIPCGLYCLSFCRDLRKVQAAASGDATVTGQFMLIRRSAYEMVGGHATIREFVSEDVALAKLLKKAGARVELWDGRSLLSTRMYSGWKTLWPGLSKNLIDVLGGPAKALAVAAVAFLLAWAVWLVPIAAAKQCIHGTSMDCVATAAAVAGSAAAIGLHLSGTRYFDIPLWYGLLFPIAYTIGIPMAIDSIRQRLRRKVQWKGRHYPGRLDHEAGP